MNPKLKKYLKMIGLVIVYYLIPSLVTIAIVFPFQKYLPLITPIAKVTPTIYYGLLDPFQLLVFFLFLKFIIRVKKPLQYCGFSKTTFSNLALSGGLGLLMGVFTYSIINQEYLMKIFPGLDQSIKYFILGGNLYLLFYIVIINSIKKEIIMRGLIFKELRANLPVTIALFLQALIYGAQTIGGSGWVIPLYGFFGALLFGVIFYLGKSLWSSILAQMCCTLGMIGIDRTLLSKAFTNQSALYLTAASILGIIVLLLWLKKSAAKQTANSGAPDPGIELGGTVS